MKQKKTNQKKNIILHGINIDQIKSLQNKESSNNDQIIILEKNVYILEKTNKCSNAHVFPFDPTKNDIITIKYLLEKKLKKIDGLIIYTSEPIEITLTDQINNKNLNNNIQTNINTIFLIIKSFIPLLKKSTKPFITIYLHKNIKNIKAFLSMPECINSTLTTLSKILNQEYKNIKNIRINLLSTENINLTYKKRIYPYKKSNTIASENNLIKTHSYLLNKNIKNKILIL